MPPLPIVRYLVLVARGCIRPPGPVPLVLIFAPTCVVPLQRPPPLAVLVARSFSSGRRVGKPSRILCSSGFLQICGVFLGRCGTLPLLGRLPLQQGRDVPQLTATDLVGTGFVPSALLFFCVGKLFQARLRVGEFLRCERLVVVFGALDDVPQESGVRFGFVGWSRDDVSAAAR